MQRITAAASAASLVVGFAVADATGVRALGGAVLVAGGAWCARRWQRTGGTKVSVALVGVALVAFVMAHVLAIGFGWSAYPTVFLVAAIDAAAVLATRPAGTVASRRELAGV